MCEGTDPAAPRPVLFLWQSRAAVVIGKNQNPWAECDPALLAAEGVPLGRRVSGGGAVFHDPGNLNYALVMRRAEYDADQVFDRVLRALHALALPAERLGRSGLGFGGRKFSGTAFGFRADRALHHGTLLVASDLDRLGRFLTPAGVVLRTRAIASQRAAVMNLNELRPDLTVERVGESLAESWAANGGRADEGEPWAGDPRYESLCRRHASAAWRLGRTPRFEADHEVEHASGRLAVTVVVEEAVIAEVRWRRPPPPAVENAGRAAWKGLAYERFIESLRGQNVLG